MGPFDKEKTYKIRSENPKTLHEVFEIVNKNEKVSTYRESIRIKTKILFSYGRKKYTKTSHKNGKTMATKNM